MCIITSYSLSTFIYNYIARSLFDLPRLIGDIYLPAIIPVEQLYDRPTTYIQYGHE